MQAKQVSHLRWVLMLLGLATALLLAPACASITPDSSSSSSSGAGTEATPTPIPTSIVPTNPTYEVKRGEVVEVLEFSARVSPVQEEELFFRSAGYVELVNVQRDDEVKAGDLLAEQEVTDLKNQLSQAQNELMAVRLDAERQIAEAQANVDAAKLRLEKLKANNPSPQITIASVNLERAQQSLFDAQDAYQKALDRPWEPESVRESYARGLHQAELNLKVAEAQYQQAQNSSLAHQYDVQIMEHDVELAQMRLQEIEAGVNISRTLLNVQRIEGLLSDARLVAPFDGVVTAMSLLQGRMVDAYDPVIIIGDPDNLELSADLMSTEMSLLAEEMTVTIELPYQEDQTITGIIRRLPYPYSGGGRTDGVQEEDQSVRITPDENLLDLDLEMGDRVQVEVVLEYAPDTLWLPPHAVRTFEGRTFVVLLGENGMQQRKDVRVGVQGVDRVEILEGLEEGQVVLAP